MATETTGATVANRGWSVVITYRARAALYQLTQAEQQAVHDMLDAITRDGWDVTRSSHLSVVTSHDAHGPYYGIRPRQAPDIEVFARLLEDRTVTVIDVLRVEMLRNVAASF